MSRFTDTHELPVDPATLLAHYTNPDFLLQKYAELGREEVELLDHSTDGDKHRLEICYLEHTEVQGIPDFARKLLNPQTRVQQKTEWDLAAQRGQIMLDPDGPAHMRCELQLEETTDGCRLNLSWDIKVSVPLIGTKLEKYLMQGMQEKSRRDESVSRALLRAAI